MVRIPIGLLQAASVIFESLGTAACHQVAQHLAEGIVAESFVRSIRVINFLHAMVGVALIHCRVTQLVCYALQIEGRVRVGVGVMDRRGYACGVGRMRD